MAGNALRNLINLGDIWNNQDLELGEKIF